MAASNGGRDPATADGEDGEEIDAPQATLNRMREAAISRGDRRAPAARARSGRRPARSGTRSEQYTGRDPQGLNSVVNRLVKERGWSSPVAVGSVMSRWDELVGGEIAAHCRPESFAGTEVQVRCDSTAWATQLRLLRSSLLARFDADLGVGVVTKIQVIGPVAPNWRKGFRSVSGRGPRDTYG